MKIKSRQYVTIIKDKLNHHYYSNLIGQTFRVSEIVEGRIVSKYQWKRAKLYGIRFPDNGSNAIFYKLKVKNHLYKKRRPQFNKYCWWQSDEIRNATPEEIQKAREREFAEAI